MEITFTQRAYKELQEWQKSGNTKILKRIRELTASIIESPFSGIGKPEPLKHHMLVSGRGELIVSIGIFTKSVTTSYMYFR